MQGLQKKTTPQTAVPYNLQNFRYVVGRSPDSSVIYYSSDVMVREDGKVLAIHGDCAGTVDKSLIEKYEVVIPNDRLLEDIAERRI